MKLRNDRSRFAGCQGKEPVLPLTKIMPETRECPLCGGTMQLKRTLHVMRIPGQPAPAMRSAHEWSCPECDYFEEADEEEST